MKKLSIITTSIILSTTLVGCSTIKFDSEAVKEPTSKVQQVTSSQHEAHEHTLEHLLEVFHENYPGVFISEIEVDDVTKPIYQIEGYDETTVYHLTYDSHTKKITPISEALIEADEYYIPLDDTSLYNAKHIQEVAIENDKTAKIIKWHMTAETGNDQTFITVQTSDATKEIVVDNATQEILQQEEE